MVRKAFQPTAAGVNGPIGGGATKLTVVYDLEGAPKLAQMASRF